MGTLTWNSGSGDWFDQTSWTPDQVPTSSDTARVTSGMPQISSGSQITGETVILGGSNSGGIVTLQATDAVFVTLLNSTSKIQPPASPTPVGAIISPGDVAPPIASAIGRADVVAATPAPAPVPARVDEVARGRELGCGGAGRDRSGGQLMAACEREGTGGANSEDRVAQHVAAPTSAREPEIPRPRVSGIGPMPVVGARFPGAVRPLARRGLALVRSAAGPAGRG